ncbi:MAG: hypothetical protein ACREF4_15790 [Gammaproteobacteria bacterium]
MPRVAYLVLIAFVPVMAAQPTEAEEARGNDFPTVERVLFVEACVRDHPDRARTEMLYKCSCAIDSIATELSYAEYVDASTAFAAGQAAGERGTHIRESSAGEDLAGRYRQARANARKACMLP